jgi:hypothetical protein
MKAKGWRKIAAATARPSGGGGGSRMKRATAQRGVPAELALVWLLFVVVAVEITVTYARVSPSHLYHVSGEGVEGGLGRALVFVNFPVALVAIGIDLLLHPWLESRLARILALLSALLCAVVAWPGVVEQSDLDPKPVNILPAAGVGLALALTAYTAWTHGFARPARVGLGWRIPAAALTLVLALPWLAAELGFYLDGVPLLGRLLLTGDLRTQPGDVVPHPAVHHGHHHGMDGALLVLTVLLLVAIVPRVAGARRVALAAYLSLMACYGAGNVANDDWLEQVVKRGWTGWQIPGVTTPAVNWGWGVIVLAAIVIWLAWARRLIEISPRGEISSTSTP